MNLYLISQEVNNNYDTYDSAIVVAENEEQAKGINPDGSDDWDGEQSRWGGWCSIKDVKVEFIGIAKEGIKGVVCASFNAG